MLSQELCPEHFHAPDLSPHHFLITPEIKDYAKRGFLSFWTGTEFSRGVDPLKDRELPPRVGQDAGEISDSSVFSSLRDWPEVFP